MIKAFTGQGPWSMYATVTDKGQVTVPKKIRDELGIRPGSKLVFELGADRSLRVSVLARGAQGLFGLLHRPGRPARSIQEMEAGVTKAVTERARPARR
jgi:AbrB family looped-hinge helix DNA binding protein